MIDDVEIDLETYQTIAFGLSMLSLGFWFGSRVTGQLAYQEQMSEASSVLPVLTQPEWVSTVQTVNNAVLAIFVVCMIGVLAADYWSRDEEERPTLESIGLR